MGQRRQKLGVLIASSGSAWMSCNSISPNLIQSYKIFAEERKHHIQWISIDGEAAEQDLRLGSGYFLDLARKIVASDMTDLVFLDHHIDPLPLLVALKGLSAAKFLSLRYVFHIYGDFTLFLPRWLNIGKLLRGTKAKFVCASERQRGMVSFFERKNQSVSTVCPFPVNSKLFRFSSQWRREIRRELKITENQTVLLYTGRLSLQKGIHRLVDEFQRVCHRRSDLQLILAGPYDDLAGRTCGISAPIGFYYHELAGRLRDLPKRIRDRIFWLGDLHHERLKKIYSAADLFVSLSLHHDEDFGMCPAEALSSGLPCVLTSWGGYAAFRRPGLPCTLIPVSLGNRGLVIDNGKLQAAFDDGLKKKHTPEARLAIGKHFEKQFGIAAVAKLLTQQLDPASFERNVGFDWPLSMVCHAGGIFKGDLYNDVYRHYVET